jgi:diguanylate cyclase (GGDEF)-like protein
LLAQRGDLKKVRVIKDSTPKNRAHSSGPKPEADVFASPDVFTTQGSKPAPEVFAQRDAQPSVFAAPAAPQRIAGALDPAAILASVGEAPYEWSIVTDKLSWGVNAGDVLKVRDVDAIATGRTYAKRLDAGTAQVRFDAVMNSPQRDEGAGVPYQVQYSLTPQGAQSTLWIEETGRWFAGKDGKPERAHGVVRAINERHAQEEKLSYLSHFDGLTGEMNRWHLTEVLETTLQQAIAQRGSCGLAMVAIDNLARLNEAYGFEVADEVIGEVAKRLRAKMRGGDVLGRFSGNKFAVILNNCTPEDMEKACERLLAGVRDDVVRTPAGPVAVTVTIGGVTAPRHATTVTEIFARAQEALNSAKAKRRGSFQAYRPNVERDALRRENVRAADEIVDALNERRILLAFEPVVDAKTRQPAFHECLMRIRRADGTFIRAQDVIPVAERLGLVRMLDHRVLELLVNEMVAVPALAASLNVSPASTMDPDWWSALDALLRANKGVAERLTVEITEMAAIQDIDDTRGFVRRVKDLGCKIAIDDFGAGFTSFRNLRQLGVDVMKIDGAYVQNLARSEDDRAFVLTLIELAKRLGLKTVAEWVQDEDAAKMLADWGCDYLQGALVGLASVERPWGQAVQVDRRKNTRG